MSHSPRNDVQIMDLTRDMNRRNLTVKYLKINIRSPVYAQNASSIITQNACALSTATIRCPNNHAIILVSVFYGVSKQPGNCVYTPGDCIADALSTTNCATDSLQCVIFANKKKLPECNNQYGDYLHIEHQCVPIWINDSSKVYNICQNGPDINSDRGMIRSPGYPTQFQITAGECLRAIHVAHDKVIRLWLTDMYIGSTTASGCSNDHVYVVDSTQTFRNCGQRRLAYPYLCSPTIFIQYKVTTSARFYRGMSMYFEIVNRSANDNCSTVTVSVTPVPQTTTTPTTIESNTTTNTPIYVLLGIASPTRSIQLCKGQSTVVECPANYVVIITKNVYSVTQSNQCEPHDTTRHCFVTMESNLFCNQKCTVFYMGNQRVPSCNNQLAVYQYIEYQCIPKQTTLVTNNTPCPTDGSKIQIQINRNGRFRNVDYPNLKQMNCTYRVTTAVGNIMHIYALDISMNGYNSDCNQGNKMTIIDGSDSTNFCEERNYKLIYSSCTNEFDLNYAITDISLYFSDGIELYIESQTRPFDWFCGTGPTTTRPPLTTTFTLPTVTSISASSFIGALNQTESDICFKTAQTFLCPSGFTFMMNDIFYGVKQTPTAKCGHVLDDCIQDATSTITTCQRDQPACFLAYSTQRRLANCKDQYADYIHVIYQCIPSRELTLNLKMVDICESKNDITAFNGLLISPNYPTYLQTTQECKRKIVSMPNKVLKIWINEMAIASGGQRQATENSTQPNLIIHRTHISSDLDYDKKLFASVRDICPQDYLIINAPHLAYVYCGTRKLSIPPICADEVYIQYKTTALHNLFFKGFKMYFEMMDKPLEITCGGTPEPIDPLITTTPGTGPWPIWAQNLDVSPIFSQQICLGTMATISCARPSDYMLSIDDTYYGVTGTGQCEASSVFHCHQETSLNLPCTRSCSVQYILPRPLTHCSNDNADYMNINYHCIPTRLPNNQLPMDICATSTTETLAIDKGMLISPQYPELYTVRTCSKTIETVSHKIWKVYIVDLFLASENNMGICADASLTVHDGNDKLCLCGLRSPTLILLSCSNKVQFNFVSNQQALGYRGFKVYFETVNKLSNITCDPGDITVDPAASTTDRATTQAISKETDQTTIPAIAEKTDQTTTPTIAKETDRTTTLAITKETDPTTTQVTSKETDRITTQTLTKETDRATTQATSKEMGRITTQTLTKETDRITTQATSKEMGRITTQVTSKETGRATTQATSKETDKTMAASGSGISVSSALSASSDCIF